MRYATYNKTVDGGIVGGICYSAVMNDRFGEVVSGQWRQRTRGCSRLGISHNWPPYPSALCRRPSTHMMNIYIHCDRAAWELEYWWSVRWCWETESSSWQRCATFSTGAFSWASADNPGCVSRSIQSGVCLWFNLTTAFTPRNEVNGLWILGSDTYVAFDTSRLSYSLW